jgi:hypothetical protein
MTTREGFSVNRRVSGEPGLPFGPAIMACAFTNMTPGEPARPLARPQHQQHVDEGDAVGLERVM